MVTPYTRRRDPVILDADNPLLYDEAGILKDGHGFRVPMNLMDAAPRRSDTGLVITTGLRLDKQFYRDGTAKPRRRKSCPCPPKLELRRAALELRSRRLARSSKLCGASTRARTSEFALADRRSGHRPPLHSS